MNNAPNTIISYLSAIRPKTLFASVGPVIIGFGLAYFFNRNLDLLIASLTLGAALFMQIGTNLVNDYFDGIRGTDNNQRLGPKRAMANGLIPAGNIRFLYRLAFCVALIQGIFLMYWGGPVIIAIGISSMLLAYAYTGGPYPLSHYPLGELLALVFFGPVAVGGTFLLQTGHYHSLALLAGLGVGAIAACLMGVNNLRDRESDQKVGKFTLAVAIGERWMRAVCLLFIIASSFFPLFINFQTRTPWILLATFLPYAFSKVWQKLFMGPIDAGLNQVLAMTGLYLFLYSICLSIGLNL